MQDGAAKEETLPALTTARARARDGRTPWYTERSVESSLIGMRVWASRCRHLVANANTAYIASQVKH